MSRFFTKTVIGMFSRAQARQINDNLGSVEAGFEAVAGEIDGINAALGSNVSPGTSATSTSTLTIGPALPGTPETKTLNIDQGKFFSSGQWITITQDGAAGNQMQCRIDTYEPLTGNLVAQSFKSTGSGTASSWIIAIGPAYDDSLLSRAGGAMLGPITGMGTGSTVKDAGGTERAVGFRNIPSNPASSTRTIDADDDGQMIPITTGGIIVPANATEAITVGFVCSFLNDSSSPQTITAAVGVTLRQVATSNVGNRTLNARGMATFWKKAIDEWYVSGPGLG